MSLGSVYAFAVAINIHQVSAAFRNSVANALFFDICICLRVTNEKA